VIGLSGALAINPVLTPDLTAEIALDFSTDHEKFLFDLRTVARTALNYARLDLATSNLVPLTVSSQLGLLGVSAHQDVEVVNNCALATFF